MSRSFEKLGLDQWLIDCLRQLRIQEPTPIQAQCIPEILKGSNIIGQAATGTGKTAAFALPMIHKWFQDPFGIFGIILTPTRELAIQITEQMAAFTSPANAKIQTIIGGLDMMKQSTELASCPHFIVATPGRLADILRSNGEEIRDCYRRTKFLVLDEADRLLDQSFEKDLSECMNAIPEPEKRQTLLFTATLTPVIRELAKKQSSTRPTKLIEIHHENILPLKLKEEYVLVPFGIREAYLYEILKIDSNKDNPTIIFVNKKSTAESLTGMLKFLQIRCTCIHGQQTQRERMNSLGRFRAQAVKIFIATDVASRGLDIPAVELVINYDIPKDPDDYVHRVGRTARAERAGRCISFVTPRDTQLIEAIERKTNREMRLFDQIPIENVVLESLNMVSTAKREAINWMIGEGFFEKQKKSKHRSRRMLLPK